MNIGIVIVTYNPDLMDFKRNINIIAKLNLDVLIIDNFSEIVSDEYWDDILNISSRIFLERLSKNMGIGVAQNIGINFFIKASKEAVLFLDQDSYMNIDSLNKLVDFMVNSDANTVAVGPSINMGDFNIKGKDMTVDHICSSGSLIKLSAFKDIGLFREDFFIDFVDFEWCWRAVYQGKKIYQLSDAILYHETSGVYRKYGHTIDPDFRLYYIFRNGAYIMRYIPIKLKDRLFLIWKLLRKMGYQLLLDRSLSRLKLCLKGLYEGWKGSLNKINE